MKKYQVLNVLFLEIKGSTEIEITAFDIETGEIKSFPYYIGALYRIGMLPKINSIIER